jgi:hypothetical protein
MPNELRIKMATTCRISWNHVKHVEKKEIFWNEICAWAIEHFGLPGDRFITHANTDYMDFNFYDDLDATMFSLRWNAETIPYDQKVVELVGNIINGI